MTQNRRYRLRRGYYMEMDINGYPEWYSSLILWDGDLCKYVHTNGEVWEEVRKKKPDVTKIYSYDLSLDRALWDLNSVNDWLDIELCEYIDSTPC